jgi:hypothetical protein
MHVTQTHTRGNSPPQRNAEEGPLHSPYVPLSYACTRTHASEWATLHPWRFFAWPHEHQSLSAHAECACECLRALGHSARHPQVRLQTRSLSPRASQVCKSAAAHSDNLSRSGVRGCGVHNRHTFSAFRVHACNKRHACRKQCMHTLHSRPPTHVSRHVFLLARCAPRISAHLLSQRAPCRTSAFSVHGLGAMSLPVVCPSCRTQLHCFSHRCASRRAQRVARARRKKTKRESLTRISTFSWPSPRSRRSASPQR